MMLGARNTYLDVERSDTKTAIIPVGAVEQHGPHLPLGVDWMLADAVAAGVGEKIGAYVLPAMPFGASQAHEGFRGSVWLEHETLALVVKDLAHCLMNQGFRRIIILNMHGGNIVLKVAVRESNFGPSQNRVMLVNPWLLAGKELSGVIQSLPVELHAGELETSLMLHLYSDLVNGQGPDHVPDAPPDYFDYLPIRHVSPEGVWGKPSLATAEKGKQALEIMVEKTATAIIQTFQYFDELELHSRSETGG
ncbi:MAG: creatininase family protein [Chloroflexi bacterium]|nr:creatininase family protein [Chloroflexota bacterium]